MEERQEQNEEQEQQQHLYENQPLLHQEQQQRRQQFEQQQLDRLQQRRQQFEQQQQEELVDFERSLRQDLQQEWLQFEQQEQQWLQNQQQQQQPEDIQQQQQQHEQEQEAEEQEGLEEEEEQEGSENEEEEEEEYLTLEEQQELKILEALDLPVHETSVDGYRPARYGESEIELHKRKEFTPEERNLVCLYATHLMGWKQDKSKRQKVRIAEAALDLGVRASTQSHVERKHRNRTREPDALAVSVQEAWRDLPATTITKIFDRIPVVLDLIVEHGGNNDLVETQRGLIQAPA